jgi:hypothetical protein
LLLTTPVPTVDLDSSATRLRTLRLSQPRPTRARGTPSEEG